MMNRRDFLKYAGIGSASVFVPSSLNLVSLYKNANAAVAYDQASITAASVPTVMPQIINVFLYGGPSELAGNLTNITEIENASQNSYEDFFGGITQPATAGGLITPNGFWSSAGGNEMEFLINPDSAGATAGTSPYMSVYRTLMKRKDSTRSHRESILMSLKGSLDIDTSAGVGTRMAALLATHATTYQSNTQLADGSAIDNINNLLLPFVSFEGETRIFAPDPDVQVPLTFRGTTLDNNFDNPFTRNSNSNASRLDALVNKMTGAAERLRYSGAVDAFEIRNSLASQIGSLDSANDASLPLLTDANDIAANGATADFSYPNNDFGRTLKSAVTLAIHNPSTVFISVGGSLGGWDDHNNGVDDYPSRMRNVMQTLRAAMWHIKQSQGVPLANGNSRMFTDNIIINVFGDFGRRVNLNNSMGWDHGNNQNLFTLGGAGVRSAAGGVNRTLGKIVGTTQLTGEPGTNNQFTEPVPGSYEIEPMSVAASLYSYLGVENPEILTSDADLNPLGDVAIDETQ
jgi:hypothetical protein